MPPSRERKPQKSIEQLVEELGLYPLDAFIFVQEGLHTTVEKFHGQCDEPDPKFHITGQQLCQGLRDLALERWGLLAPAVLRRWNIRRTDDFGRIVFALVENGDMQKTDGDSLNDFRNVFDFETAFADGYQIGCKS